MKYLMLALFLIASLSCYTQQPEPGSLPVSQGRNEFAVSLKGPPHYENMHQYLKQALKLEVENRYGPFDKWFILMAYGFSVPYSPYKGQSATISMDKKGNIHLRGISSADAIRVLSIEIMKRDVRRSNE